MLNRRWGMGLHVMAAVLLSIVLFVLVNVLGARYYQRLDLTSTRMYTLSEKSIAILTGLSDPLTITLFYQPDNALYDPVSTLLKEYAGSSPQIRVEKVDPHRDIAQAQRLAQRYKVDALNVVVFESGGKSKYVTDEEIAEFEFAGYLTGIPPRMIAFKGEEAFTSAILSVTQARLPAVRFATGHAERPLGDAGVAGISQAVKLLRQDNMDVGSVTLLGEEKLDPAEVDCLIIAGPKLRFSESELELVRSYLEAGGAVLALLDPLMDSGVERVAAGWGIDVGQDIVVDPAQKLPFVSAANVFITSYTDHEIVRGLEGVATLFPLARSVSPAGETPEGVQVSALASTTEGGWGESDVDNSPFSFDEGSDREGPVSIAAAMWRDPSRMVVVGDSDFVTNAQVANLGNSDLFLNSVNWLLQREKLISISPKIAEDMRINLTNRQMGNAFWQIVIALPALSLSLGGAVWWKRRK